MNTNIDPPQPQRPRIQISNSQMQNYIQQISNTIKTQLMGKLQVLFKILSFISLIAPYIKVILSTRALWLTETTCNQSLQLWINLMLVYDILKITATAFEKAVKKRYWPFNSTYSNSNEEQLQEGYEMNTASDSNANHQIDDEGGLLPGNNIAGAPERAIDRTSNSLPTPGWLKAIYLCAYWLYVYLFWYGNGLFFSSSDCATKTPLLYQLLVLYLGYQYIRILSLLLSVPAVILYAYISARRQWQEISEDLRFDNLEVKKYPIPLANEPECAICICNYEEGNEIVELDCNRKHHFHADCIKKWLEVNRVCPVCRMTLREMKQKKRKEETENTKQR